MTKFRKTPEVIVRTFQRGDQMERRPLKSSTDEGPLSVFGPPALYPGEDRRNYDVIAREVLDAVRPRDFIEKMLLRDIIDGERDVLHWRKLKAGLLASLLADHLANALDSQGIKVKKNFIDAWLRADTEASDRMIRLVKDNGLDLERAKADCLVGHLDRIDKMDDQMTKAEARRNAHLRQIQRHREALACGLFDTVAAIEAKALGRAA